MRGRGTESSLLSRVIKHLLSSNSLESEPASESGQHSTSVLKLHQDALRKLVTAHALYSGDLREGLKEITKVVGQTMHVERVSVWLFDEAQTKITCIVQYNLSKDDYSEGRVITAKECPAYFDAIRNSRVIAAHDVLSDPRTSDFTHFGAEGISSMLDAPIYVEGKLVGIVCHVQLGGKRTWTADEQKFAGSTADMAALAFEVTERRRVEQQLRESRAFLRTVLDTAPSFIWVKDRNGKLTMANQALAELHGCKVEELEGKFSREYLNEAEAAKFEADDREVIDSLVEKFIVEEKVTDFRGEERWLQTIKRPLRIPGSDDIHVLGTAIEITERKQLESQLRQSQKIEAIGQLAGGIAHDFNNLLNGVLGYSSLLKHRYGNDPELRKIADRIEQAGQRAQQLTEKLIGFARQGKHQNIAVDVHAAVDETASLLQRTIETNIDLDFELQAEQLYALGDPVQIQQIVLNLAINARDAMSPETGGTEGGSLVIGTKNVQVDAATPDVGRELHPGSYILLTVSDSGCGIAPDVIDRIFDPFFTTKKKGKGTGMGLSMVFGIVQNHGGTIRVRSQLGVGTTFLVYLPCVEGGEIAAEQVEGRAASISGRGLILLVDDDEVTREVTADMLQTLGYDVVCAKDGSEAVSYYRSNFHHVDAIILDMVMPKMGGRECFRACKRINPNVRAILSTGYDNNHSVQSVLNEGMVGFIQKPYTLERLSEEVAGALSLPDAVCENDDETQQQVNE